MLRLNLALNNYAFHWSFPEIVAEEVGLFKTNGIEAQWEDVTPPAVTNKTEMYTDLLRERKTDVYHAGEWACINRVSRSEDAWMVARSNPGRGTLNSTFAIFVRRDSEITKPTDLAGEPVAIEAGTGSYYTAVQDLERFIPKGSVNLVQLGEPHKRLLALRDGKVKAASLVGPWPAIGEVFGLKMLIRTMRKNPTTMVTRKDINPELLTRFLRATNGAISLVDRSPRRFLSLYLSRVERILDDMPSEFSGRRKEIEAALEVPTWRPWRAYTPEEFVRTSRWMRQRGLLAKQANPQSRVAHYPKSVYR